MNSTRVQPASNEIDSRELIDEGNEQKARSKNTPQANQAQPLPTSLPSPWSFNLLFAAITVCLSSFTFGYNIVTLEIGEIFTKNSLSSQSNLYISERQMGFVMGSLALGALVASLISGPLADRYGRKNTLILNAVIYLLGIITFSFSASFVQMLIGRIVIGFGAGIACVVVPMYLSEISYLSVRGFLGIFHQTSLVVGVLTSQIISYWLGNEHNWVIYYLGSGVSTLWMLLMLPFCPESPVYLMLIGDREKGEAVLRNLRPPDWPVTEEVGEIDEMLRISKLNGTKVSIARLLTLPIARKSLLFGMAMHFAQQFSGIDLVLLFPGLWFKNPRTISIFIGSSILVATLFAIWLVERAGRRKLTLASSMGCCIGLTLLTFFSHFQAHSVFKLLSLFLYISTFSIGLGPITWIIINDIFPPDTRASAMTLAVSVNWLSKFAVTLIFSPLVKRLGPFVLLPLSFILFLFFWYAYLQMQETKGRPASYL